VEVTPTPRGEGNISLCHLREKIRKRGREKGENVEEKGGKGKEKGRIKKKEERGKKKEEREELWQKGHHWVRKMTYRERGKNIIFGRGGGGDNNIVFGPRLTPGLLWPPTKGSNPPPSRISLYCRYNITGSYLKAEIAAHTSDNKNLLRSAVGHCSL
jgi:hypothetical protein